MRRPSARLVLTLVALVAAIALLGLATSASRAATEAVYPPVIVFSLPIKGTVGTVVTLTGKNFTGTTKVKFGSAAAPGFDVDSDTKITATVPATASTGTISVTTPAGTGTTKTSFKVLPTITGFTPTSGHVATLVKLTGTGFTGTTAVHFGSVSAAIISHSATSIHVTVPNAAVTGTISVTTSGGTATSKASFRVLPKITEISPTSGAVGTLVKIKGTGFTGTTAVNFGSVPAHFTVVNGTQIKVNVPVGAVTGKIAITNPDGTVYSSIFVVKK